MPKYTTSEMATNSNDKYADLFEKRHVKNIKQYRTHVFQKNMEHSVKTIEHVWSVGDRYHKLAHKHYGDLNYWWIIAYFNKAPTEGHLVYGDYIYIPYPLSEAKMIFGE